MTSSNRWLTATGYSRNLLIYDAGDTRTAFVTFWKATAIFQFGTCTIFLVPMLYNNQNQPDENIRLLQAAGGILAIFLCSVLHFSQASSLSCYLQLGCFLELSKASICWNEFLRY